MTSRWLSRLEVSEKYGPSAKTLANWGTLNKGPPFVRVGGRVRYREDDVEAWLARQPRGGDAADKRTAPRRNHEALDRNAALRRPLEPRGAAP